MLDIVPASTSTSPSRGPATPQQRRDDGPCGGARLVLCGDLEIESRTPAYVVIVHTVTSRRLKLTTAAFDLAMRFQAPAATLEIANTSGLRAAVERLVGAGVLVDPDAADVGGASSRRLRNAVPYRFCNAPAWQDRTSAPHLVIVGIPYDLGSDRGCRMSPLRIRERSLGFAYRTDAAGEFPLGWFDANRGLRILRGATMADIGDIHVEYSESRAALYERVDRVLSSELPDQAVLLAIGGDIVAGLAVAAHMNARMPVSIVRLVVSQAASPHNDIDVRSGDATGDIEQVFSIAPSGIRRQLRSDAVSTLVMDADALALQHADEIVRSLRIGSAIHLSIDLTCPMEGVATGAVMASWRREVGPLILAMGRAHRIVSIDLVGLPDDAQGAVASTVACHLALTALSAAHDRV